MTRILFLLVLFCSVTLQAQNIRGKVCMEKDKSPAQFASVGLMQLPDSTLISGVITLTDGGYEFDRVKPGNYRIKVNFVGYTAKGTDVTVQGTEDVAADTIFLSESATTLGEVTVVGERLKGKEMVDRTVYSIPDAIAKSSANGYEILKKIPQVNVDFQNNITMNGSSNFIIQVDGRQRDKEFLAKLQPSDIETVEIVNNPSGKYEGNIDGVINIVLKKEARYGMNGNFGLNLKPFNKITTSATGSLDYAMGKVTFYVTAFTFTQNLYISSENVDYFKESDSTSTQTGNGGLKVSSSSVNAGLDYYMNDKNNLSFNISYKPIGQDIDMLSQSLLYSNDTPVNTISTVTANGTHSDETTVSLFYKRTFKKPIQEFTADASFYTFKSKDANDFTNNRYLYDSDSMINTFTRLEDVLNDTELSVCQIGLCSTHRTIRKTGSRIPVLLPADEL